MYEPEIESEADAAFYLATEVIQEYHDIPVVQRADFGQDCLYVQLNGVWHKCQLSIVTDPNQISRMEQLVP